MLKTKSGFTIVELLIVIVVIGILAAITIVAYNGIQQRAENTKTVSAVTSWVKALNAYKVVKGTYPTLGSCLGDGLLFGPNATSDSSQVSQCRQDIASEHIASVPSFYSEMSEFIKGNPTPSLKTTFVNSSSNWYRGAHYTGGGGTGTRLDFVLMGSTTDCPIIGGLTLSARQSNASSNATRCLNLLTN